MSDVFMYKGGTPEPKYMWCKGETTDYHEPYGHDNMEDTAPFDAHFDGAYGSGLCTFATGMPFNFKKMPWQKNALKAANVQAGDFIRSIWIPCNHFVEYLRFDVARPDIRMAGATVRMSAQYGAFNSTTNQFEYTPMTDVADAATAQSLNTPIALDKQSSTMISLLKTDTGYVRPLYVEPAFLPTDPADLTNPYKVKRANPVIYVGLEVVSLPTAPGVTLDMAMNDWYLSIRLAGFRSPSHM